MCGIAGIFGKGDISTMLNSFDYRGPDGTGVHKDGVFQLGAQNLKIIDEGCENQPFYNEDRSICVILNGEIYNYEDIKKELTAHKFRTKTDTEMIVHAYEEFGLDCVQKFNGCFVFAIWDGKRLVIGRDRLGQKPLYYYFKGGRFIFSSEIKSILTQINDIRPNLPESFFAFENPIEEETMFKDIYSLPRASLLTFDRRDVKIKKYWRLPARCKTDLSENKCIERLRWLIQDSIRLRSYGDGAKGLFLSGGLDSSLIAYIAKPSHVFTASNVGDDFDEVEYANLVARDIKAEHFIIAPGPDDFKLLYKKIIWHLDQPIATASTLPAFLLAKEASKYVRIILSGEGADELFGGYVRYLLMYTEEKLGKLPILEKYYPLAQFFWNKNMFCGASQRYFDLIKRNEVSNNQPYEAMNKIFVQYDDLLNSMSACDIDLALPSLLTMADRACSAFGLENRSPFLDYRIAEFAFSLPKEMKIKENQTKYILREAARGIVPDKIINRTDKIGLISPVLKWLSSDLSGWRDEIIRNFKQRNILVNRGSSRGEFDRYQYMLLSLELWYQVFFDNNGAQGIKRIT